MLLGNRNPINIPPGVNKEDNAFTSFVYTDADKIRFSQGFPEKIGGWVNVQFNNKEQMRGVPRSIYSYTDSDGIEHIIIGTNTCLYDYESGNLNNITPLSSNIISIPNSLSSLYSVNSNTEPFYNLFIVVRAGFTQIDLEVRGYPADWPFKSVRQGDLIKISDIPDGTIGGIPTNIINGIHTVSGVYSSGIQFVMPGITPTGGFYPNDSLGYTLTVALKTIKIIQPNHGFSEGDRIKISDAQAFAGFTETDLNGEYFVRNYPLDPDINSYSVYLKNSVNFATSAQTNAGGANIKVQHQIPSGNCSINYLFGYGGGLYGEGEYNVGKSFGSQLEYPRIWSMDKYGDILILTPGNQSAIYQWDGNTSIAPTIIPNAPSEINYCFVAKAENQVITFGANNIENQVYTSDNNNITNWDNNAADSLSFRRNIEGSSKLIAHAYLKGQYLLFSLNSVYVMYFVDKPDIWIIKLLTDADGLIGPKALVNAIDTIVWRGHNNYYIYNGYNISILPNNPLFHWEIDNIHNPYSYLCFFRNVPEFEEIWFFFPDNSSSECNNYIIWNYSENHFTNGRLNRTAAENLVNPIRLQYLVNGSCNNNISKLYQHDIDYSDDNQNMTGSLTTNYRLIGEGDYIQEVSAIIPSNYLMPVGTLNQGQDLYTLSVNTKEYDGQLNVKTSGPYKVTASTKKIDTRINGRQIQYIYEFANKVGFRIQKSYQISKPFTVR